MNHALSEQFFKSSERQGEVGQEHHDAFILGALWAMDYFDKKRKPRDSSPSFRMKREDVKCWCENCDVAANIMRTWMPLCPECKDKRCPRAVSHEKECTKTTKGC